MNNNKGLVPYKANLPDSLGKRMLELIKTNKQTVGVSFTVLFLLYVVSTLQGIEDRVSEPIVKIERDTVINTVVKTKVKKVLVSGSNSSNSKNENAPVSASSIPELSAEQYIQKYKGYAISNYKETGVLASITLAQGLVESAAGNSKGARIANNHFGIKCNSKHHKWCCVKAKDDSNADSFKLFKSAKECYKAHADFLHQARYKKLFTYGKNYRNWAYGLKQAGYATDKNYASKLIGVIERYNLHQYDM